jgi:hypothetical protein
VRPRRVLAAARVRLDQGRRRRAVAAEQRDRAGHRFVAGNRDRLAVAIQLLRFVARHLCRRFRPRRRHDVRVRLGIPHFANDGCSRERRVVPSHADLVLEVIRIRPAQVRMGHAEDGAVIGLDSTALERRRRKRVDDRDAAVGHANLDQAESIAEQPYGRGRREELDAQPGDDRANLAGDHQDGPTVRSEHRGEIARVVRYGDEADAPCRHVAPIDLTVHGRFGPRTRVLEAAGRPARSRPLFTNVAVASCKHSSSPLERA